MRLLSHAVSQYLFTLTLGVRSVLRGRVRDGLKLFIAPVGYWRVWPNAWVGYLGSRLPSGARVLDVSSPKGISLYLASSLKLDVTAIDLDDPALVSTWAQYATDFASRYHVGYHDATRLPFADESFDFAYSVSVIEHIPDDGDTKALSEMARVVKPGGRIFVEVPFRNQASVRMTGYDSKGAPLAQERFYERFYDQRTLDARLTTPLLRVVACCTMSESLPIDPWIATPRLPKPLRILALPIEPFAALLNLAYNHRSSPKRPLSAMIEFERMPSA